MMTPVCVDWSFGVQRVENNARLRHVILHVGLGCGIASPLAPSDFKYPLDQGGLKSSPRLSGRPLCSMFFYFFLVAVNSFIILQSIKH